MTLTARLRLRALDAGDALFILELLTEPSLTELPDAEIRASGLALPQA